MKRRKLQGQRGVTLIELMVAMGVSFIVVEIVVMSLYFQHRTFADQLDYSEAQQNGRATIALLKRYLRNAGWGFVAQADAIGAFPVGACFNASDPQAEQTRCDAQDLNIDNVAGVDRLRVVFMQPTPRNGFAVTNLDTAAGQFGMGIRGEAPLADPFEADERVAISGQCIGGGAATALVTITSRALSGAFQYEYGYTPLFRSAINLACPGGFVKGHSAARATVADFYLDRQTDPLHPTLRVRFDPSKDPRTGYPVAYDIDDFQVHYFLDTDPQPDQSWDAECDDLTANDCAPELGGDIAQKLHRILAVRVSVVTRTRTYSERRRKRGFEDKMNVENHTFTGKWDGYRRWIYSTTVMLRNNVLR